MAHCPYCKSWMIVALEMRTLGWIRHECLQCRRRFNIDFNKEYGQDNKSDSSFLKRKWLATLKKARNACYFSHRHNCITNMELKNEIFTQTTLPVKPAQMEGDQTNKLLCEDTMPTLQNNEGGSRILWIN